MANKIKSLWLDATFAMDKFSQKLLANETCKNIFCLVCVIRHHTCYTAFGQQEVYCDRIDLIKRWIEATIF